MKRISRRNWLWEFSKRLVIICSALYVFGFFYACIIMWFYRDFTYLGTFIEPFLTMLLVVSIFSGLFTEAVKKALNSVDTVIVSNNILAGIVSVFLSFFVYSWYIVRTGYTYDAQQIIYLIALVLMSWLSAMVGYDKVVQAIIQITSKEKEG